MRVNPRRSNPDRQSKFRKYMATEHSKPDGGHLPTDGIIRKYYLVLNDSIRVAYQSRTAEMRVRLRINGCTVAIAGHLKPWS